MEIITNPTELKAAAVSKATHFWYVGVILIMLLAGIFSFQLHRNLKQEYATLKAKTNIAATITELDAQLKEMERRKAELYPQLAKQQADLLLIQKELEQKRKGAKNVKKDQIISKIDKMDVMQLNNEFRTLGYATEVEIR